MDEKTIRELLGEPDQVIEPGEPRALLMSTGWQCGRCKTVYSFAEPSNPPAPCEKCGCIGFAAVVGAKPLAH